MKITKSTVVRTIMFLIVVINMTLKYMGKPLINVEESTIYQVIEYVISIIVLILSFWKNNSFSKNAIKADEYLLKLKEFNGEGE